MSKPDDFHSVESILKNTLKDLKFEENIKVYSIWKSWKEIVGENLAKQTKPGSIRGNCLSILVKNHVWMNELQYIKPELIEKINNFSENEQKIDRIIFKLDS